MKSIIISIKPKYVKEILNGNKTLEIRKTAPKCELPCEVYIYCTKGKETLAINPYGGYSLIPNKYHNEYFSGKVVAKFTLNKIERLEVEAESYEQHSVYREPGRADDYVDEWENSFQERTCVTADELEGYVGRDYDMHVCLWHIDELKVFDKPKDLSDYGIERAPQSFMYVEVEE